MHLYFTTLQFNATIMLEEALKECSTYKNKEDIP